MSDRLRATGDVIAEGALEELEGAYPACRAVVGSAAKWAKLAEAVGPRSFPEVAEQRAEGLGLPPYLADLARLERNVREASRGATLPPEEVDGYALAPGLRLLETSWSGLPSLLDRADSGQAGLPDKGNEWVLVWPDPETRRPRARPATAGELLALKVAAEGLDPLEVARSAGASAAVVQGELERAVRTGLLRAAPSRIRREVAALGDGPWEERFLTCDRFTLQWHVTHACDLHCRHCYDRSDRSPLPAAQGVRLLDDFYSFCREHHVRGRVTFTGGNPLLHPQFADLYREAWDRGFTPAILGNPAPRSRIEELVSIGPPDLFQVSLEGLGERNDSIRGSGSFDRAIAFLGVLRELGIHAMVMLTLTRENQDQILPLARRLRGLADTFHFNRLSRVGEGAALDLPDPGGYRALLERYLEACEENPILGLKDNLINILRHRRGLDLFGGCTGFGCGAAFNFLSVLPDGEAHACRKFPSPLGNVLAEGITAVYHSDRAARYRAGCETCRSCPIRPACGGCLASAHSFGLDPFKERDPFCFWGQSP